MKRLPALATLGLVCLAPPAQAQAGEELYNGPGGWRVLEQEVNCVLLGPEAEGLPRLAMIGFGPGRAMVEIALPQPLAAELGDAVEMRMGEATAPLQLGRGRKELVTTRFSASLHEAFRTSPALQLAAGNTVFAAFPLEGSREAYGHFDSCVASLPTGPIVPPPAPELALPPRASVPEPQLSGMLPPNRRAVPIMPQNWLAPIDYPMGAHPVEGRTGYIATVGTDGRIRDCRIAATSGSYQLDAATCTAVSRRARFDPATDAKGNPVEGEYAGHVNWRLPE